MVKGQVMDITHHNNCLEMRNFIERVQIKGYRNSEDTEFFLEGWGDFRKRWPWRSSII